MEFLSKHLCIYPMNQQSCLTGIPAGVFHKNGKNLNGHQYWVSLSSRGQQQQGDRVVVAGDTQHTTGEVLVQGWGEDTFIPCLTSPKDNNHIRTGGCWDSSLYSWPSKANQSTKWTKKPTQNVADHFCSCSQDLLFYLAFHSLNSFIHSFNKLSSYCKPSTELSPGEKVVN